MKPLLRYVNDRMQNLSNTFFTSGMVGNNQSRLFSLMPCGKNATTWSNSQALGTGFWSMEEGMSFRNVEEATDLEEFLEGEGVSLRNV